MQAFDSPWKQISETYFPQLLKFYYPKAFKAIDWEKPVRCLDKELPKLTADARTRDREADKLFEVHRKKGDKGLVYLHIEFQNQRDPNLSKRMFTYYYRIFDKVDQPVWSLVILGDRNPRYRPNHYTRELWDLSLSLRYPVIKLKDYETEMNKLLRSRNPFALVTAAHLIAQKTRGKPRERMRQKLILTKLLYKKRFTKKDIVAIFRFIDWVLNLSETMARQFKQSLAAFEGEQNMEYITSIQRIEFKDGLKEGRKELSKELKPSLAKALVEILTLRFGAPSQQQRRTIERATLDHLRLWLDQAISGQMPAPLHGKPTRP
ncbi:Rpn family recombination-promoting nuclease/putative transposase [Acanthopleuribacter pedis]|uniref:Rpn family recombination-promoting nuclease/putative transposase n=1 Tax=Acanthopleuribacter pedis TaxID=442870 RepID=A0A8J7Q3J3_9BACT|nr:Rpn family recombination-promoting nuclease/putative transposase [Acanthopleuribacter pedis]MBO1317709.1 Rpn family recombination-promoting nuclease/putative transposase [Acanthopleuribacter pedis]